MEEQKTLKTLKKRYSIKLNGVWIFLGLLQTIEEARGPGKKSLVEDIKVEARVEVGVGKDIEDLLHLLKEDMAEINRHPIIIVQDIKVVNSVADLGLNLIKEGIQSLLKNSIYKSNNLKERTKLLEKTLSKVLYPLLFLRLISLGEMSE